MKCRANSNSPTTIRLLIESVMPIVRHFLSICGKTDNTRRLEYFGNEMKSIKHSFVKPDADIDYAWKKNDVF